MHIGLISSDHIMQFLINGKKNSAGIKLEGEISTFSSCLYVETVVLRQSKMNRSQSSVIKKWFSEEILVMLYLQRIPYPIFFWENSLNHSYNLKYLHLFMKWQGVQEDIFLLPQNIIVVIQIVSKWLDIHPNQFRIAKMIFPRLWENNYWV